MLKKGLKLGPHLAVLRAYSWFCAQVTICGTRDPSCTTHRQGNHLPTVPTLQLQTICFTGVALYFISSSQTSCQRQLCGASNLLLSQRVLRFLFLQREKKSRVLKCDGNFQIMYIVHSNRYGQIPFPCILSTYFSTHTLTNPLCYQCFTLMEYVILIGFICL